MQLRLVASMPLKIEGAIGPIIRLPGQQRQQALAVELNVRRLLYAASVEHRRRNINMRSDRLNLTVSLELGRPANETVDANSAVVHAPLLASQARVVARNLRPVVGQKDD